MILESFQKSLLDYRESVLGGNYPIVWSFFCDPERYWGTKHAKIIASSQRVRILKNLGEIALWLAQENDYVILSREPSAQYLEQIPNLKIPKSHILVCESENETCFPEAIQSDKVLKSNINAIVRKNKIVGYLPFGSTAYDDRFRKELSLVPMLADSVISTRVNTKVYSRHFCNSSTRFPVVPGRVCKTATEVRNAFEEYSTYHDSKMVVVKDPNGVSGKGISIFTSQTDLNTWLNFQTSHGTFLPEYIVETWIPSEFGFNHAFLLFPDGTHRSLSLKKSILDRGRHRSHIDPLCFDADHLKIIRTCQSDVAKQLHQDGYFGFVGIDGIKSLSGEIYPLIEINARVNWSAAQLFLRDTIAENLIYKATELPFVLEKSQVENSTHHILNLHKSNTSSMGVYVQLEQPLSINMNVADRVEMSLFCILYGDSLDRISHLEANLTQFIGALQNER